MSENKRYPLEDMEENRRYFGEIADLLLSREKERNGFGTLQEKTIHEVIKDFYCYDHDFQEQKRGRYIADIAVGDDIWEIQTRAFNKLRGKLDAFLEKYHVTVIYLWRWRKRYTGWIRRPAPSPVEDVPRAGETPTMCFGSCTRSARISQIRTCSSMFL